jgi:DNA-binding NarL/FixJ family response regulator
MPLEVSIVEDDRITREALAAIVNQEADLRLLATYADAEAALADVPKRPPAVLVVDIGLAPRGSGRLNGPACVAALKAAVPALQVLMLTVYNDQTRVFEALRAGASGYLLKRSPASEIVRAIRDVGAGGAPLSTPVARLVVESFQQRQQPDHLATEASDQLNCLTPRERDILALLAEGDSSKQIAARLGLTPGTVRAYLHTIYEKLGVENRTQAAVRFLGTRSG